MNQEHETNLLKLKIVSIIIISLMLINEIYGVEQITTVDDRY